MGHQNDPEEQCDYQGDQQPRAEPAVLETLVGPGLVKIRST
jgi:hypothetical protein